MKSVVEILMDFLGIGVFFSFLSFDLGSFAAFYAFSFLITGLVFLGKAARVNLSQGFLALG